MNSRFTSLVSMIPGYSIPMIESIHGKIVLAVWVDDNYDDDGRLKTLLNHSDRVELYSFIGPNSELMHDSFDDIIIEVGCIGKLTTFNNLGKQESIEEVMDMSSGYRASVLFVAISNDAKREFLILGEISTVLAKRA